MARPSDLLQSLGGDPAEAPLALVEGANGAGKDLAVEIGPVLLDGYILLSLVMGARVAFRVASHSFRPGPQGSSRRVLLYGAGDAGVAALQELLTNHSLDMRPIGFLDDDPSRRGQLLRGYKIFDDVERLISSRAFDELVISTGKIPGERLRQIGERCMPAGISVRRFSMEWGEVPHDQLVGDLEVPELQTLATGT